MGPISERHISTIRLYSAIHVGSRWKIQYRRTPCDINAIYTSLISTFSELQYFVADNSYGSIFIRLVPPKHEKCQTDGRTSEQ